MIYEIKPLHEGLIEIPSYILSEFYSKKKDVINSIKLAIYNLYEVAIEKEFQHIQLLQDVFKKNKGKIDSNIEKHKKNIMAWTDTMEDLDVYIDPVPYITLQFKNKMLNIFSKVNSNDDPNFGTYNNRRGYITINYYKIVKHFKDMDSIDKWISKAYEYVVSTFKHEVIHYIEKEDFPFSDINNLEKLSKYDADDVKKYVLTTNVEFQSTIRSLIEEFKIKYRKRFTSEDIVTYITEHPFFEAIREDENKYRKAVKYFYLGVTNDL